LLQSYKIFIGKSWGWNAYRRSSGVFIARVL